MGLMKPLAEMDAQIRDRRSIEQRIVIRVVEDLLAAGFKFSLNNGGDELEFKDSTDKALIFSNMMETDEDKLHVKKDGLDFRVYGWIQFIYGNDGYDVISDYATILEQWLKPINDWAENLT